jgi:hypothetical protein
METVNINPEINTSRKKENGSTYTSDTLSDDPTSVVEPRVASIEAAAVSSLNY